MTAVEVEEAPAQAATPTLYQKLLNAARAIDVVGKDGRNTFHKYDYSSIEAVAAATRGVLLEHGLLLFAGQEAITDRQRQTKEGEATVTTIELTFRFVDVDTGETLSIPWVGRGEDPADKGVSKALTDARKTFLIQQLNLIRGEDTEADESTDQRSYGNGFSAPTGSGDMTDEARGLTNAQLNAALVSVGLPAQEKPWGTFTRIPSAQVQPLREALQRERANSR